MRPSPSFSSRPSSGVDVKFDGASFPQAFRDWLYCRPGDFVYKYEVPGKPARTCKLVASLLPAVGESRQDSMTVYIPGRDSREDGKVITFSSREDLDLFTAALKACWDCWREETKASGQPDAASSEWTTVSVE
jgi:hypothetical protein